MARKQIDEEIEKPELEEEEYDEDSDDTIEPEPEPEPEPKPKRKYIRKQKEENIEVKKAVLVKKEKAKPKKKVEKVVYIVQDDKTNDVEEVNRPFKKLTKKQAVALEREEQALKQEIEAGKQLVRTKKGMVDKRSSKTTRTAAQIEATKRLVEMNRLKREQKMKANNDEVKESVSRTVKEVLSDVIKNPRSLSNGKTRPEQTKSEPIDIPAPLKKSKEQLMKELLG